MAANHNVPLNLRRLKAEMVLKGLSLTEVAKKSKVRYQLASLILNGRFNDPGSLLKIETTIKGAPMPEATAA
jgi:transcriptional regulator with XRE-family HTH domain